MKTLIKILTVLCAVIGVYFMAMAAIEASSRRSDDRMHIAQLKGRLPFGKLTKRREAYDGEEVVARRIADYRDDDYELDDDDDETLADAASAVTSRLLRKVKQADPEGQKRKSRLRKAVEAVDGDDDDKEDDVYYAEEIDEILPDAADFSEDALEDLLDS